MMLIVSLLAEQSTVQAGCGLPHPAHFIPMSSLCSSVVCSVDAQCPQVLGRLQLACTCLYPQHLWHCVILACGSNHCTIFNGPCQTILSFCSIFFASFPSMNSTTSALVMAFGLVFESQQVFGIFVSVGSTPSSFVRSLSSMVCGSKGFVFHLLQTPILPHILRPQRHNLLVQMCPKYIPPAIHLLLQ